MNQSFQIVFSSNPKLGDSVARLKLQLANPDGCERIFFEALETNNYEWTDWFVKLPENESLNLFLLDENKKTKSNFFISGLYIEKHKCSYKMQTDSTLKLYHKAHITFTSIEKIDEKGFYDQLKDSCKTNVDLEWNKNA